MAYDSREEAVTRELRQLLEKARGVQMTPEQLREQRRSFVYGNTHIENDRITRQLVAEVDDALGEDDTR
jgi:hypothetical protein